MPKMVKVAQTSELLPGMGKVVSPGGPLIDPVFHLHIQVNGIGGIEARGLMVWQYNQ